MFEQFIEQQKSTPQHQPVELDLSKNMVLNPQLLWDKLSDLSSIDDKELFELLKAYYGRILEEIFNKKDPKFIGLFQDTKFIAAFTQVMYNIQLTDSQRRQVNKLAYDYLILPDTTDEYTKSLLIALAKTVNRNVIPRLCAMMPETLASLLAMARYSSEKEVTNVKRVNRILMKQPSTMMNEQLLVDIYLALFDHILPLFEGIMLDVIAPQTMSPDQSEIYGLITLAALDIMNELPIEDIKLGLTRFADDKRILYSTNSLRINLESCSPEDYPRLLTAIDMLKSEGWYLPLY